MKKKNLLSIILSLAFIGTLFVSCKKDKDKDEDVNPKLNAVFSFEGNHRPTPGTVVFTNKSENAVSYSWDFGDDNVSTEKNPTHVYSSKGEYEVVLTATDNSGDTDTYTRTITMLGNVSKYQLEDIFI